MNIRIKEIGYYHPKNKVSNQYFLDFYDKQDVDIRGLLEASGKKDRYISTNPNENALTMAIEAANTVLKKSNLIGEDLDLIIFVSDTPEYLAPSNASKIHYALKGKNTAGILDINCNCVGMLTALEQASKIMKHDKNINKVLIVGAQQLQRYARKDEPIVYAIFGDSSCALILEKTNDENSDFVDNLYFTNSKMHDNVHFPAEGVSSSLPTDEIQSRDYRVIHWSTADADEAFKSSINSVNTILEKNNIKKEQIKKYFCSQMFKSKIDELRIGLDEPEDKFTYIGDMYGYTGATSPFLALAKAIENGEIKRGDYIVLWSIAAGITTNTILLRY